MDQATNITLTTDEKSRLAKLLKSVDVIEIPLPEKSRFVLKELEMEEEERVKLKIESLEDDVGSDEGDAADEEKKTPEETMVVPDGNPYRLENDVVEELCAIDEKIACLKKGTVQVTNKTEELGLQSEDPKRPWRTNGSKELLFRIDSELKELEQKGLVDCLAPMSGEEMSSILRRVEEVSEGESKMEDGSSIFSTVDQISEAVENAKKCMPNFKFKFPI